MKLILKKFGLMSIVLLTLLFFSCGEDDLFTGNIETDEPSVSFSATPWSTNANYIILENTSTGDEIYSAWKFNEDSEYRRDETPEPDTAYYPEPGMYEITLLAGNDAGLDSVKQTIVIDQRDPDLPDPNADNCLVLGDFEDGQVGDWNAWGQDVTVASNPKPSPVNSSDQVLKISQTEAFSQNANRSVPVINTLTQKIEIDVYFEVAGSLKLQIEADFGTGYFLDVPAGEWITLVYELEEEVMSGTEYPWILFQGNTAGNYYLDNIKYCGLDVSGDSGKLLGDFEDEEVGDWNAWGQDVTVAANPAPNAVNASDNTLLITQSEAFSQNANRSIPEVTGSAKKIEIDVYFDVAGSLKLQIEDDFATGFFLDVPAGEWVTLTYNLEGQVDDDTDYPWILFQGNCPGNYYIDNIKYFE